MIYYVNLALAFSMILGALIVNDKEFMVIMNVGGVLGLIISNAAMMIFSEIQEIGKRLPNKTKTTEKDAKC